MAELPAPLATADCNLRGFQWMPLDVSTLVDSEFFIHTTGPEFKAAIALWCKSWVQVPAGSLPNNDVSMADLSRSTTNWKKVKDGALRGWVLCSDNRWYHPIIVAKAMEVLPSRKAHADNKAAANERKERERVDRKRLFALLRENGIVPDIHIKMPDLRKLAEQFESRNMSRDVTRDTSHHVTAKTGQDRTGEDRTGQDRTSTYSVPDGTGGSPPLAGGLPGGLWPTDAGLPPPPPPPLITAAPTPKQKTAEETERAELWHGVKLLLVEQSTAANVKAAGDLVGKQASKYGRDVFVVAARETLRLKPADAFTYLIALCETAAGKRLPIGRAGPMSDEQRDSANAASDAEAKRLLFGAKDKPTGDIIDA